MKVVLKIQGPMQAYFPVSEIPLELSPRASVGDMYDTLGKEHGVSIKEAVWNREKHRPRGPVILRVEGKVVKDEAQTLSDGQVLELKRFLIGG